MIFVEIRITRLVYLLDGLTEDVPNYACLSTYEYIKRDGAEDRHFRYEGTLRDRVMALPSHLETTSLRLYLLNIQAKILILGNGGLKNTATYEEDENLHRQVRTLQKIDIELKQREKKKVIVVTGTELLGELSFSIEDE